MFKTEFSLSVPSGIVSSIASCPSIDLFALPAPGVIAQAPEFTALVEIDPAMKLLEADSYDETVLAQSFADAARGLLLAFATASRLDHLAALFAVERLEGETDTALRQHVQLAPHSFSAAGPKLAYVYWARTADSDVADATDVSPTPGQVVVTVLSAGSNGVPGSTVPDAVTELLTGPVRPLTDEVIVQPASLVTFGNVARLWVFAGPDQGLLLQTALDSLNAHLAALRKLGRSVTRSALIAALHVANVQRVELDGPDEDIVITAHQLASVTDIDVTIAGTVI